MMYYMYYKDSHYCEITGNKIKVYPQRDNEGKYIKTKDPKQALLTKYTKQIDKLGNTDKGTDKYYKW